MEYNLGYSFALKGNCFGCYRITKMNAGQHIGAIIHCNNVEKLLSCFKCCFYPQDLFVLLSKLHVLFCEQLF